MASDLPHRRIKREIGAEILAPKSTLLSGDHAAEIRDLLEQCGVLVMPRIDFSDDELIEFTRSLGEYAPDKPDGAVTEISIDPAAGNSAEYTLASFFWHFDGYMNPMPIRASILAARVLSDEGGDTEFANCYTAWEAMPDGRKAQIEGLSAVHAMAGAQRAVEPEPSHARLTEWLKVPSRTLPLVWKHRSGRRSLVIGNTALGVVGMDPLESFELLTWLRDWATQERFAYRHHWSLGDCVIWDNTGTLHRATPYPPDSGRLMVRTKLAGEEPLG